MSLYSKIFAVASSLAVFSFDTLLMVEAMSTWNQAGDAAVLNVAANWVACTTQRIAPVPITVDTTVPASNEILDSSD